MKRLCVLLRFPAPIFIVFVFIFFTAAAYGQSLQETSDLSGTSWQLVKFQSSDGKTLTPDSPVKYTITFETDGHVSVSIDCNRGHGMWKSAGAGQLEFGALALTRAMCPPAALNDRLSQDWEHVRSYALNDGHLLLSLSDGGTYEFERTNSEEPAANASTISGLPASFIGTLPCADCPGIHYHVDILPDHRFVSRITYEGRTTHLDDHGHWQLSDDGNTLVLHGGRGALEEFAVAGSDTLRKLDAAGHEIVSKLNYELKREAAFTPIETGSQETANAPLENTKWELIQLGDAPVDVSPAKRPHFVLNSTTEKVSGFGGCNQLAGSYILEGDHLAFRQTVSTMMACVEGMETEKEFLQVFSQVNTWKINGQRLEFFDSGGKRIATFEARETK